MSEFVVTGKGREVRFADVLRKDPRVYEMLAKSAALEYAIHHGPGPSDPIRPVLHGIGNAGECGLSDLSSSPTAGALASKLLDDPDPGVLGRCKISTVCDNVYDVDGLSFSCPPTFVRVECTPEGCRLLFSEASDGTRTFESSDGRAHDAPPIPFPAVGGGCMGREEFFASDRRLSDLDPDQVEAVSSDLSKDLVIVAGAGSGKTRTAVARLCYMVLVEGIPVDRIMMLTFTNAATRSMKDAAESLMASADCGGYLSTGIKARTFDSFFKMVAERYRREIGFRMPPVFAYGSTVSEKIAIVREAAENSGYKISGDAYNVLVAIGNYLQTGKATDAGIPALAAAYTDLQFARCRIADFSVTAEILRRALSSPDSGLACALRRDYDCIIMDEFQDISILQNSVFRELYFSGIHFTMVGDDDQAVYQWRGSDVSIMRSMSENEAVRTIFLRTNYRSNPHIVSLGNAVLAKMPGRAKANLSIVPYKTYGPPVRLAETDRDCSSLAFEISRLGALGADWNDIAVLFRTNRESDGVQKALKGLGIPFVVRDQSEIITDSDMLVLLNLMLLFSRCPEPQEKIARICTVCGVSAEDVRDVAGFLLNNEPLDENAVEHVETTDFDFDLAVILAQTLVPSDSPESMSDAVKRFAHMLRSPSVALSEFTEFITGRPTPWPTDWKNVVSAEREFVKWRGERRRLDDAVTLSTIHGAKGLQFPIVFVYGFSSGTIPNEMYVKAHKDALEDLEAEIAEASDKAFEDIGPVLDEIVEALGTADSFPDIASSFDEFILENRFLLLEGDPKAGKRYLELYESRIHSFLGRESALRVNAINSEIAELGRKLSALDGLAISGHAEPGDRGDRIRKRIALLENEKRNISERRTALRKWSEPMRRLAEICESQNATADVFGARRRVIDEKMREARMEELRVFYVAVSRAIYLLYLCPVSGSTRSPYSYWLPQNEYEKHRMVDGIDEGLASINRPLAAVAEAVSRGESAVEEIDALLDCAKGRYRTDSRFKPGFPLPSWWREGKRTVAVAYDRAAYIVCLGNWVGVPIDGALNASLYEFVKVVLAGMFDKDVRVPVPAGTEANGFSAEVLRILSGTADGLAESMLRRCLSDDTPIWNSAGCLAIQLFMVHRGHPGEKDAAEILRSAAVLESSRYPGSAPQFQKMLSATDVLMGRVGNLGRHRPHETVLSPRICCR